ncbi:MAG: molybdenum cofactor guanylyltransferase [Novosphingobium sp.]
MSGSGILGVVLAGGQSSRFGSDKALAQLDGRTLIELAVDSLAQWCETVVIVGRDSGPAPCLPDWPGPGMGPLGGLAAALRFAQDEGYAAVLSCGVDSPGLPDDLPGLLAPAPAYFADQPVIGLWPPTGTAVIAGILEGQGRHSMRAFAEAMGARAVTPPVTLANVNWPDDLTNLSR